ncbi:hypothetical protein AGMMS49975_25150 [Clostridia bacterium]|nr:hypothetical protein AGMMS49975_25150 [Clostridia bacterium]
MLKKLSFIVAAVIAYCVIIFGPVLLLMFLPQEAYLEVMRILTSTSGLFSFIKSFCVVIFIIGIVFIFTKKK